MLVSSLRAMGSPIIQSRRPEFVHKACTKCHNELEFSSTTLPSSKIFVQCYSCQKICEFEVKGAGTQSSASTGKNNNKWRFGSGSNLLYRDTCYVNDIYRLGMLSPYYFYAYLFYKPSPIFPSLSSLITQIGNL